MALGAGEAPEQLAEEGVLECAVDDDVVEAGVLRVLGVVVDLVEVAGAGGPVDELLAGRVLLEFGDAVANLDVLEVDLVGHCV